MAKLDKLPAQSIIDGLKGTLDYYVIHVNPTISEGINVCRTWPRYSEERMSTTSKAMRIPFAYITSSVKLLPPIIIEAYQALASPTRLTWKDVAVRCYINGDNVYPRSTTLDDWWNEDA